MATTDDIGTYEMVFTGKLVATNLLAHGVQDVPPETWADLRPELEPVGFWYENGQMHIPTELCAWWGAFCRGASENEMAALWPKETF